MSHLGLRYVEENDIELIFNWSNDKEVRKNSFHTETIKWEEHVKWFKNIIENKNVYFFILEDDGNPIGQIRIKFEKDDEGIISFSISKEFRGFGFGKEILRLIEEQLNKINMKCKLIGLVKIDNIASKKSFVINGYTEIKLDENSMKYVKNI